jgi:hypothetical protein
MTRPPAANAVVVVEFRASPSGGVNQVSLLLWPATYLRAFQNGVYNITFVLQII